MSPRLIRPRNSKEPSTRYRQKLQLALFGVAYVLKERHDNGGCHAKTFGQSPIDKPAVLIG